MLSKNKRYFFALEQGGFDVSLVTHFPVRAYLTKVRKN
jgi:hypothetical protein